MKLLLGGLFVLWLASVLVEPLGELVASGLSLRADGVFESFQIWTVFTYAFWHQDFIHVLFMGVALWLFGGELEQSWTPRRWWGMNAAAIAAGGLAALILMSLTAATQGFIGYHAPVSAAIAAFCWRLWDQERHFFFFPMTGRTLFIVFIVLFGALSIFAGHWSRLVADMAGVAVGFAFSRNPPNFRDLRTRFRLYRARRKLKLVRPPEKKDYGPN